MIPVKRPDTDSPDALVWHAAGEGHYLCAHCIETDSRKGGDGLGAAYEAAIAHLWRSHSLKHVWLHHEQPHLENAKQLAFSLAIQHNTQFDRRW
jgi:hypothetical protein